MKGKNSRSNVDMINGLKYRELSSLKRLHDDYVYSLSGVIALIVPDEEIRNEILERTFISVWHEAESYEPSQTSIFIWLLRISIRVMGEQMNIPLLEMQNKVYHAYRNFKANSE